MKQLRLFRWNQIIIKSHLINTVKELLHILMHKPTVVIPEYLTAPATITPQSAKT